MRLWPRKQPKETARIFFENSMAHDNSAISQVPLTSAEKPVPEPLSVTAMLTWIDGYVEETVHRLASRVMSIMSLAEFLGRGVEFRSARTRESLEALRHEAAELAKELGKMRSFGSVYKHVFCNFVVDILQPVVSFSTGHHYGLRLAVDRSAREAPRVELRQWPTYVALELLLRRYKPEVVRCGATSRSLTVSYSLLLSGDSMAKIEQVDPILESLFREAGIISFQCHNLVEDSRLIVNLEMERER
jgi:hypothetical protein